jgi:hypothetical protein
VGGMCMQPAGMTIGMLPFLRHAGVCKRESSLDGRSAAAVKELGMTLGGELEQDRRSHTERDLRPACGGIVWPLDEGAACPLYVRTVDQGAVYRRRM